MSETNWNVFITHTQCSMLNIKILQKKKNDKIKCFSMEYDKFIHQIIYKNEVEMENQNKK